MTRLRWVAARKAEGFPTTRCCEAARVSRQAFYDWRARRAAGPSERERAEADLLAAIRGVHAGSGGAYGSPRVTAQLRAAGRVVNRKRVERLMRAHQIAGIRLRRPKRTTTPARTAVTLPDLLGRDFAPGDPRSGVGVRHHLHPHRRGLAVPRSRARLGQPPAVGLPDERPHRRPLGPRRPQHGRRGPRGLHRRHRVPFRSRQQLPGQGVQEQREVMGA